MTMNKNQYVDSVMRVLGNSSIELTLDDLEELQILLESEYLRQKRKNLWKVLESENDRVLDKTYLSQRMLMHLQAG